MAEAEKLEKRFFGAGEPRKTPKARPTAGIFGGERSETRGHFAVLGAGERSDTAVQRSKARTAWPERAEGGARGARECDLPLEPSGGVPRRRKGRGRRLKYAARERGVSPLEKAPREIYLYRAFSGGKRRDAFAALFGRAYLNRSEGARNERHRNRRPRVAFHISPEAAAPIRLSRKQRERRGGWACLFVPQRGTEGDERCLAGFFLILDILTQSGSFLFSSLLL